MSWKEVFELWDELKAQESNGKDGAKDPRWRKRRLRGVKNK